MRICRVWNLGTGVKMPGPSVSIPSFTEEMAFITVTDVCPVSVGVGMVSTEEGWGGSCPR